MVKLGSLEFFVNMDVIMPWHETLRIRKTYFVSNPQFGYNLGTRTSSHLALDDFRQIRNLYSQTKVNIQ